VVGTDRSIHRYNNGSWINMSAVNAKRVDVAYGSPYMLRTNNDIYRNINNGGWQKIAGQGFDIGGSNNALCVIGTNSRIYKYNGNNNWSQIKGILGKRIDVTPQGAPWIIGTDDHVYQHLGGEQWGKKGNFKASDISISGSGTIWALQLNTGIPFKYEGGGVWEKFRGVLTSISAQDNGNLWGTNVNRNIYENICPDNKALEKLPNTFTLSEDSVTMYPNPVTNANKLYVEIPEAQKLTVFAQIIDLSGKVIKSTNPEVYKQRIEIDIAAVPKGMYMIRIFSEDKTLTTKPIIIK